MCKQIEGTPSANGSPDCRRQAGYEPTANIVVKHDALKCCASDRGPSCNKLKFIGIGLSKHWIKVRIMIE